MNYFDFYKSRVLGDTTTLKQSYINDLERDFENFLKDDLSSQEYYYSKINEFPSLETCSKELMFVNDLTQNDKKAYDEKKLLVRKDLDIDVGCYIFMDSVWYLIIFKEHRTIDSYKKFIMKRCNQFMNYVCNGKLYKIPVSIQSLTLYSDGLADLTYLSYGDAKNRISYGTNDITKTINIGTRIMTTKKTVYRVTNLTDFEYNGRSTDSEGLISALVLQTTLITEDDIENNIAYNPISVADTHVDYISGKDSIYLGEKNEYSIDFNGDVEYYLDFEYANTVLINNNDNKCTIRQDINFDSVGNVITLIAKDISTKTTIDMKNIIIRGV